MLKAALSHIFIAFAALISLSACSSVDSERVPPAYVNIVFSTIGDWERYGVSGAGNYRTFIAERHQPAGFPYKGLEGTGYGGVLLVVDPMGQYCVYDLACPYCCPSIERIFHDADNPTAGIFRCPKCGSTYDAFAQGTPRSDPALKDKCGLQRYNISISGGLPYAIIRN